GNQIHIGSNGFTLGQAVTYYAPAPLTFHSTQVDVTTTLNNNIVQFSDSSSADNIYFVQQSGANEGERLAHGFQTNDKVVYHVTSGDSGPATSIGLVDGQV